MHEPRRLVTVDEVEATGSWVCTVETATGELDELLVVACDDVSGPPVRAWINRCMHEDQRLYRDGIGAIIRDGAIVCPRHGSHFDTCSGDCDNGEAAGTTLVPVTIEVIDGQVYLDDDAFTHRYDGPIEDDDGMPGSTSHIQF